ncbi:retrotransposable element Tf2, partial [Tanacetum coccineum]
DFCCGTDALGLGISVALQQEGHPIAYLTNALSRVECSVELNSLALSTITSDLLHKIRDSYEHDSVAEEKIQQLTNGTYNGDKYTWDGLTRERPKEWGQWLPPAEYWYNTNKHSSTNVTPFEVVYGKTPPLHVPYVAGESAVEVVDRTLQARETTIEMLKFHLKRVQDIMKMYADKKKYEREFKVGMWVNLKLQPRR